MHAIEETKMKKHQQRAKKDRIKHSRLRGRCRCRHHRRRRRLALYARITHKVTGGIIFFLPALPLYLFRFTCFSIITWHPSVVHIQFSTHFCLTSYFCRAKLLIYKLCHLVCLSSLKFAFAVLFDHKAYIRRIQRSHKHTRTLSTKKMGRRQKKRQDDAEHMQNTV